jgi:hypothetical protein
LRADGQVVIAPFQTYNVEVVPAFALNDGTYATAHTADDGSWRVSSPVAEYQIISRVDCISDRKATHLLKMLKAWKRECSVEMKSISLEVLKRQLKAVAIASLPALHLRIPLGGNHLLTFYRSGASVT